MEQVTLASVLHPRYSRDAEDKYILGKILNVKRSDKQPLPFYLPKGVAAQAKRRYNNDSNYDRIITIAENDSRNCFFMVTRTAQESSKNLHNVEDSFVYWWKG